ncbi:hypothetical protein L6164_022696 [Bauhinia variegata]|uniref:Uncharacterized protein n=1 Tax=Bauhinia variegata TaxID=167791 RepID=A0ACB9MJB9_BAUVA|nr:hypothetical protein L6164_022696 [Bauhinia variegata]
MAACKKKQRVNESRDRISNLPDCIIHRILSFLPTKDAVRTSVLSRRWIYMWTFIDNLHFDDSQLLFPDKRNKQRLSFEDREVFVRFVQGVLLHLSNPTIQSFTLVTSDWYDDIYKCVDAWIAAALYRQVQNLYVDYKASIKIYSLSLFRCQSLVDLKLMLPSGSLTFTSSYVCLPNLKFLSLSGIKLESKSSPLWISFPSNHHHHHHPIELTLSFPVLRVLKMDRCRWHLMNACLQVPLLEVFSAEKVEIFSATKICTSCPEIFSFLFIDGSLDDYLYCCRYENFLPSSASIATFQISGIVKFNPAVSKLLERFNQMQCLKLGDVEVSSESYVYYEMMLGRSSPPVPNCLESSLKRVKFGLFDGAEHELYLAKFLFEQGAILEQVFFCLSKTRQNGSSEIKKKLLSFSKCSSFCVVEFSTV